MIVLLFHNAMEVRLISAFLPGRQVEEFCRGCSKSRRKWNLKKRNFTKIRIENLEVDEGVVLFALFAQCGSIRTCTLCKWRLLHDSQSQQI